MCTMSRKSIAEYIAEKRRAYAKSGNAKRTRLLDDVCDDVVSQVRLEEGEREEACREEVCEMKKSEAKQTAGTLTDAGPIKPYNFVR